MANVVQKPQQKIYNLNAMTEKEKMISGVMYNPMDEQLVKERHKARLLFHKINQLNDDFF